MKKNNWKKRVATMAVFVAMLIPMLAVTAYASSPKVSYNFTFNGQAKTMQKEATKTDLNDDKTRGSAGVTISSAQFGVGSVSMWIENEDGVDWTAVKSGISAEATYPFYYYVDKLPETGSCTVKLLCTSTWGVQGLGGTFQP